MDRYVADHLLLALWSVLAFEFCATAFILYRSPRLVKCILTQAEIEEALKNHVSAKYGLDVSSVELTQDGDYTSSLDDVEALVVVNGRNKPADLQAALAARQRGG